MKRNIQNESIAYRVTSVFELALKCSKFYWIDLMCVFVLMQCEMLGTYGQ